MYLWYSHKFAVTNKNQWTSNVGNNETTISNPFFNTNKIRSAIEF